MRNLVSIIFGLGLLLGCGQAPSRAATDTPQPRTDITDAMARQQLVQAIAAKPERIRGAEVLTMGRERRGHAYWCGYLRLPTGEVTSYGFNLADDGQRWLLGVSDMGRPDRTEVFHRARVQACENLGIDMTPPEEPQPSAPH
ncbi:hypothetical protein Q0812_10730 [Brevundimonas sp. 2R-24]|uniref:Lipoprotein n=1 Tax=Peiella sedimenti TaxID=3061083 RepID=A0ABT8SQB7_9CAUL|nr:hypothetical protein [Caulobacteraceae bacterium XZ-24]